MRTLFAAAAALAAATASAGASTVCTNAATDAWIPVETFKSQLVATGYTILVFKVTAGRCYELYGRNAEGRRVEIYYDPVSGDVVKATIL